MIGQRALDTIRRNKKTPLTRTVAGAELVEVVTREMQLTPAQVASMAIPLLTRGPQHCTSRRLTPPGFSGRQREPTTVYVHKVDK